MNLTQLLVTRALVVGDMHGNLLSWQRTILPAAKQLNADIIVQVGDFGFGWNLFCPDIASDALTDRFLDELDLLVDDCDGPEILWLDGNHENFDRLIEIGAFDADEPTPTSEHTTYIPRGYSWKWQGVRCMALGGAYSVDKNYREPGISWWDQEEITERDVRKALKSEPVDVLFAHDCYAGVKVPGVHADWKQDEFAEVTAPNREKLRRVVRDLEVQLFIHGHYHQAYEYPAPTNEFFVHDKQRKHKPADLYPRRIIGLNRETETGSAILLEFPTLDWEWR